MNAGIWKRWIIVYSLLSSPGNLKDSLIILILYIIFCKDCSRPFKICWLLFIILRRFFYFFLFKPRDSNWKVSPPITHLLKCVLHWRGCSSNGLEVFSSSSQETISTQHVELPTNNLLFISETLWLISFNCMQKWWSFEKDLISGALRRSLVTGLFRLHVLSMCPGLL